MTLARVVFFLFLFPGLNKLPSQFTLTIGKKSITIAKCLFFSHLSGHHQHNYACKTNQDKCPPHPGFKYCFNDSTTGKPCCKEQKKHDLCLSHLCICLKYRLINSSTIPLFFIKGGRIPFVADEIITYGSRF